MAGAYFDANPGPFHEADGAYVLAFRTFPARLPNPPTPPSMCSMCSPCGRYVLAFSLIMLNTDAHSSQIKKRMTQQEFVNMNRGINDSGDLPTPFLEGLYQEIVSNEIKIKDTRAHTEVEYCMNIKIK